MHAERVGVPALHIGPHQVGIHPEEQGREGLVADQDGFGIRQLGAPAGKVGIGLGGVQCRVEGGAGILAPIVAAAGPEQVQKVGGVGEIGVPS